MSFGWEGVGIESYERVFRAMGFERVVEGEEPREVSGVRYESCPDCFIFSIFRNIFMSAQLLLPFFDSVTLSVVVILTLSN